MGDQDERLENDYGDELSSLNFSQEEGELLFPKTRSRRQYNNGTAPFLKVEGGEGIWWGMMIEPREAKEQILYALPMVITNVCYYLIPLVSVMFAGHLGQLQLAGSTFANSWAYVTGFAFMLGLSGALETLCGQGYGAKLYNMLGIYLQASCIISFFFAILISVIWWFTEPILIFLHQNPETSKEAATFLRCLIPAIFAFGTIQNILRYLQTQYVVWPTVVCSVVPLLFHFGINYVLVYCTPLGFSGTALATSITFWISAIMLVLYVNYGRDCKHTWTGVSKESFHHVFGNLKLALPSAAMVCLEYWAFEILVPLAGLFPNSEMTTSLIAMCVNTEAAAFNFTYGLSAAASTRVSNELGAGRPNQAKHAMGVTLKLSILLTAIILLALGFGHDGWAGFFSDNTDMMRAFASMTPFVCISIFLDSVQGILSAVCRGCGWQHLAVYINLGTFYLIGMPIACLLAFTFNLGVKGLWIGLICGLMAQNVSLFLVTRSQDWTTVGLSPDGNEIGLSMIRQANKF
ncbi:protein DETOXIFICATION 18 isoform X1 [Beta vulgaris subsp. vulgaris]|uniref:protein DETOXIFICATION 18 isoform X1 n=1 Tax=Beta vulgaris subsp. vulgaris TaxID=3555 RepID=UPI002036A4A8|nr:protein DETOXIFICATION 18 isoform X1 [Beta vulgaris subsp. vulgaris]XP_057252216.1 protein DETOXIFICATION 18 isoform X1 [Beta vulgaris subsp. vulgaris]